MFKRFKEAFVNPGQFYRRVNAAELRGAANSGRKTFAAVLTLVAVSLWLGIAFSSASALTGPVEFLKLYFLLMCIGPPVSALVNRQISRNSINFTGLLAVVASTGIFHTVLNTLGLAVRPYISTAVSDDIISLATVGFLYFHTYQFLRNSGKQNIKLDRWGKIIFPAVYWVPVLVLFFRLRAAICGALYRWWEQWFLPILQQPGCILSACLRGD